ncbi:MAG TPA: hypothetical protein VNU93_08420, partial [Verrucomicrobiae bacterium]|nr:hypothetical protein [Verrucomicrobiae bacterium]
MEYKLKFVRSLRTKVFLFTAFLVFLIGAFFVFTYISTSKIKAADLELMELSKLTQNITNINSGLSEQYAQAIKYIYTKDKSALNGYYGAVEAVKTAKQGLIDDNGKYIDKDFLAQLINLNSQT